MVYHLYLSLMLVKTIHVQKGNEQLLAVCFFLFIASFQKNVSYYVDCVVFLVW